MRRIAQSLGISRRTVKRVLDQVEQDRGAGSNRDDHPEERQTRQSARRPRRGDHRPAGPVSRHHGATDPRGVAPARLPGELHAPVPAGACSCVPGRSFAPCGGSRPPRESRRRWITPPTTSISRSKGAAGFTPSAMCWATRAGSTSTSSRVRTSPRPSASTSAPSSTWAESRRPVFMTT